MENLRELRLDEHPQVGDVLKMFDGPFSTGVVSTVLKDGSVDVIRPYIHLLDRTHDVQIGIETTRRISVNSIRQYQFYTFRTEISNVKR